MVLQGSGGSDCRVASLPQWLVEERLHDARAARREARRVQDQDQKRESASERAAGLHCVSRLSFEVREQAEDQDQKREIASERAGGLHCVSRLPLEVREQAEETQFLRKRIKALEDECQILRRENCGLARIAKSGSRLTRLQDEGFIPSEQLVALVKCLLGAWRSIVAREQRLRLEEATAKNRSLQVDVRQLRWLLDSEGRRALGMEAELGRQLQAQVVRLALSSWRALTWSNWRAKLLGQLERLASMHARMRAHAQAEVLRCAYAGWRDLAWRTCRRELLGRLEQLTNMQPCTKSHDTQEEDSRCERLEAQLRLVEARCRNHEVAAAVAQAAEVHERVVRTAAEEATDTQRTFASIGIQAAPMTWTGPTTRAKSSGPRSALTSATAKLQRKFGGSCRAPSATTANGAVGNGGNFHQQGQVLECIADLQLQRSRQFASSELQEQLNADHLPGHVCSRCCCCHCFCKPGGCEQEQLPVQQLAPKAAPSRLAAEPLAAPPPAGRR